MFTLDEALASLRTPNFWGDVRTEFAVRAYDGLVVINYIVQLPDSFQGIRTNFRGILFEEATGEIVSLPLHKFYNINQREETLWDKLKHLSGVIYEKLDGSMIHFFVYRGELRASTRMSTTEAWRTQAAMKLAQKDGIVEVLKQEIAEGWTPIFEYVAPNNQVVVEYSRPRLIYLISRNRRTGEYRYNGLYPDRAIRYDFKFQDIFENVEGRQEFEGVVAHLETGDPLKPLWVKCKTPWYMERHRAVDAMMRPAHYLYEVVYNGVMDDLIAMAPDRHKEKLQAIYVEAQTDLMNVKLRIEGTYRELRDDFVAMGYTDGPNVEDAQNKRLRKEFAMEVAKHHKKESSLLMLAFQGKEKELEEGIQRYLLEGYKIKYPYRLFEDIEEEP